MAQATVDPPEAASTLETSVSPPTATAASIELAIALFDVVRLSRRTRRNDVIEPAATVVLATVDRLKPARPSDIACELRLDLSTVSRHLTKLEDDGYLARTDDPEDRRTRRVETTAQGSTVLRDVLANRAATIDDALDHWSQDDRQHLAELLRRLATDLETVR